MNSLSLKKKLAIGFGTLLLILIIMAIVSYNALHQLDVLSDQVEDRSQKVEMSTRIQAAAMMESAGIRGFLLLNQEAPLQRLEQGKHEYKEAADAIQGKLRTEEGKSLFGAIERIHEQYVGLLDQEVSLQRAQNTKGALDILTNQSAPLSRELEKAIETFISHEHQAKKQIMDEQSATESKAETLVLTLAVIGVLTGIGVALLIVRSITSARGRR